MTDKIEEYIKQNNIYAEDSETEIAKFLEDRKNLHKWEMMVSHGLAENNKPVVVKLMLSKKVQKLIDKLKFLFTGELNFECEL